MMRILMVCYGNICRSPAAEAVLRKRISDESLEAHVTVDSAGVRGGNGAPPDPRMQIVAEQRGYLLSNLASRPLVEQDFGEFDLILGMDRTNVWDMHQMCTLPQRDKVRLFLDFTPDLMGVDIPDPFFDGEAEDFIQTLDLIEAGVNGLVTAMIEQKAYLNY